MIYFSNSFSKLKLLIVSFFVFVFIFSLSYGVGFKVHAVDADSVLTSEEIKIIAPTLQVDIPGFNTEKLIVVGDENNGCREGYVCVKTMSEYLNSIYKYLIGISTVLAIIMIMIGGIEWMIGSAVGTIDKAKKRIKNAITGLFILYFISLVLSFVNPKITTLTSIDLRVVKPVLDISPETILGTDDVPKGEIVLGPDELKLGEGIVAVSSEAISDPSLVSMNGQYVNPAIIPALENVGQAISEATGGQYHLLVGSGLRSAASQTDIWFSNCYKKNRGGKFSCSPLTCNPFPRNDSGPLILHKGGWSGGLLEIKPEILKEYPRDSDLLPYLRQIAINNDRQSCPHLTGHTVDVWCSPKEAGFVDNVSCHIVLEAAMIKNGFRRISNESWHFEYNKDGLKARSPSAKNNEAKIWSMSMGSGCSTKRHGEDCVFDYTVCRAASGGPDYADYKRGCCIDSSGVCCDGLSGSEPDETECGTTYKKFPL